MIIRSQSPDVVVAVGRGDAMREFECYRVVLAVASPYFDAMFSTEMRENNTSRIEYPDRDPEEWHIFHRFLAHDPSVAIREHVMVLAPMFHEFQMGKQLDECDAILATKVASLSRKKQASLYQGLPCHYDPSFWRRCADEYSSNAKPHLVLKYREEIFAEIIGLLEFSCLRDLAKTKKEAEDFIETVASVLLTGTYDLFDLPVVTKLTELFLPLTYKNGVLVSEGRSGVLWSCSCLENPDISQCEIATFSLDTINNNKMLPLLVKEHIQRTGQVREMSHRVNAMMFKVNAAAGSTNATTAATNAGMGY